MVEKAKFGDEDETLGSAFPRGRISAAIFGCISGRSRHAGSHCVSSEMDLWFVLRTFLGALGVKPNVQATVVAVGRPVADGILVGMDYLGKQQRINRDDPFNTTISINNSSTS